MSKHPKTAQDALTLWDAGEPVPAFPVEAQDSEQEAIYSVAFELLRKFYAETEENYPLKPIGHMTPDELNVLLEQTGGKKISMREFQAAHSVAFVAVLNGWAKMLRQHIGEHLPEITVTNPQPRQNQNSTAKP